MNMNVCIMWVWLSFSFTPKWPRKKGSHFSIWVCWGVNLPQWISYGLMGVFHSASAAVRLQKDLFYIKNFSSILKKFCVKKMEDSSLGGGNIQMGNMSYFFSMGVSGSPRTRIGCSINLGEENEKPPKMSRRRKEKKYSSSHCSKKESKTKELKRGAKKQDSFFTCESSKPSYLMYELVEYCDICSLQRMMKVVICRATSKKNIFCVVYSKKVLLCVKVYRDFSSWKIHITESGTSDQQRVTLIQSTKWLIMMMGSDISGIVCTIRVCLVYAMHAVNHPKV